METSEHSTSVLPSPQSIMQFSCCLGHARTLPSSPRMTPFPDLPLFACFDVFAYAFLARKESGLSGPLNRLNAILSLLQPLDRYMTPSAIGSAIGKALSRPISHPRTGRSPQPPRSKPPSGTQPRDSGAIVSQTPLK